MVCQVYLYIIYYTKLLVGIPEFAHLPLILKPIGNGKLSKRDGDKMGFQYFHWNGKQKKAFLQDIENGFFPEAVINF